jgi:hypothetical protein
LSPPVTVILMRVLADVGAASVFGAAGGFCAHAGHGAVTSKQILAAASHRTTPKDILGRIFIG